MRVRSWSCGLVAALLTFVVPRGAHARAPADGGIFVNPLGYLLGAYNLEVGLAFDGTIGFTF